MRSMLNSLKKICGDNLFNEKVIIVQSNARGNQLLQALTQEGTGYINLKALTLYELAFEISGGFLFEKKLIPADNVTLIRLLMNDLQKLKADNNLEYFKTVEVKPLTSGVILSSILEIRKAGLSADDLPAEKFINAKKGTDIKKLLKCYEDNLKNNCFVDETDVLRTAIEILTENTQTNKNILYFLTPDLELSFFEQKFLQVLTENKYTVLETNNVIGDDINAEIFRAYGAYNEVNEAARKILHSETKLDDVSVFYTDSNIYSQFLYDAAVKFDIPVTFGDGIDVRNSKSGRLLFSLLNWIKTGYKARDLYDIIISGDFSAKKQTDIGVSRLANLLIKIKIGWGRARYLPIIDRKIPEYKEKVECAAENDKNRYEADLAAIEALKNIAAKIMQCIPEENANGMINYNDFAGGLAEIIDEFGKLDSKLDGEGNKAIIEGLKNSKYTDEDIISTGEAVELVEAFVCGIRISVSGPQPGCVHVCRYASGLYVHRKVNFIIGLDSNKFPGSGLEDPVVLDAERENISPDLEIKRQAVKKNNEKMNRLIASLQGKIIFGYSSFDTFESRAQYPSFIILSIFRMLSKDKSLDYSSLTERLKEQANFSTGKPELSLEEGEWWLSSATQSGGAIEPDSVNANYYNLCNGLYAAAQRESNEFTCFDGKLIVSPDELNPMNNKSKVLTASKLETLGTCPFKYYLENLLHVRISDELEYDAFKWLDPMQKGSLMHRIFEEYYKNIKESNEKPLFPKHEALIYKIAEKIILEYKDDIPPPSEIIFTGEKKAILEDCRAFLISEAGEKINNEPRYLELSFGSGKVNEAIGILDAAAVETPVGEILYLNGAIDRVDELSAGKYRIIDYKTGSARNYEDSDDDVFKQGRQLQHALYSCAFEQILKDKNICKNPQVVQAEYVFPTIKGKGQRVVRQQNSKTEFFEILEKLIEHLKTGEMCRTIDPNDCTYCDYAHICATDKAEADRLVVKLTGVSTSEEGGDDDE